MLQHVAMQILIRVMGLSEWFTQYRTSFSLVRIIDLNPSLTNFSNYNGVQKSFFELFRPIAFIKCVYIYISIYVLIF